MFIHYLLLLFAAIVSGSGESPLVLKPLGGGTKVVGLALFAEDSFTLEEYRVPLVAIQQRALQTAHISLAVVVGRTADDVDETVGAVRTLYTVPTWYAGGHSMTSGSQVAQEYAEARSKNGNKYEGLVLIAGFLLRTQRPDIRQCLKKASVEPKRSLTCPLGCLKDGAHRCDGPNVVDYSLPVLTVAGELDGVVRITRIAEAFHTQINLSMRKNDAFAVVPGLNHGLFFNQSMQITGDLAAETTFDVAIATIADNIAAFMAQSSTSEATQEAAQFLEPIITVFVEQEGNWFFTGADDEHGSSPWAAAAQQRLASPLPSNTDEWESATNEFRLMSDEDKIPPYFRPKHRASVNFSDSQFKSNTISQLRFIKISTTEAGAGLNGYAIIKEEKLGVMQERKDDGADYVSAIEISTKMVSRQKVFNESSSPSPDSLDGNTQCQAINQKAYDFVLSSLKGTSTLARYLQKGIKMVMLEDKQPTPSIGPFWIWSYLTSTLTKATPPVLQVQSFYAFYSLSANPYGAGNHYCKLLSPARVLEWVYVDSLRPAVAQ